jgi:hypothetical protein
MTQSAHHTPYFELRDALSAEGCAVCRLTQRSLERYFSALVYESINDPRRRSELRAANGFCAVHGAMLREARSALGASILYRDIVAALSRRLEELEFDPDDKQERWWARLNNVRRQPHRRHILRPARGCPACALRAESSQLMIELFLRHSTETELLERFRHSSGLCLEHLRRTLEHAPDQVAFERIKSAQLDIWARLTAELDEFIRKEDERFADEPRGTERNAWLRAIELIAGNWTVSGGH